MTDRQTDRQTDGQTDARGKTIMIHNDLNKSTKNDIEEKILDFVLEKLVLEKLLM